MGRFWKRIRLAFALLLLAVVAGTAAIVLAGLSDRTDRADLALVPGNTVNPDGTPSPRLKARLDKAVELYRAGCFPLILASGGIGKEGIDEAHAMKAYLVACGVPPASVFEDHLGANTWRSAQNTAALLRERQLTSVFVVTQYFHVPRTRLALRRCGVGTIFSAHANFFEARDVYSSLRELAGYLEYAFRGA